MNIYNDNKKKADAEAENEKKKTNIKIIDKIDKMLITI